MKNDQSKNGLPEVEACDSHGVSDELLSSCVHCGLCLEVCPTYQLSGDENNSPRGRLRLWRAEAEGHLPADPWTAEYTSECVGCLACESACPANVPYGAIFEQTRSEHVAANRTALGMGMRLASSIAGRPGLANLLGFPIRLMRRMGVPIHSLIFPGRPSAMRSTASYARKLMAERRPDGPRVAMFVGCLMESVMREINFATVRVLIENNVRVIVPEGQGCCGAFQQHLGIASTGSLRAANVHSFESHEVDMVVTNSAGCGLSLQHTLSGRVPVKDVLGFSRRFGSCEAGAT